MLINILGSILENYSTFLIILNSLIVIALLFVFIFIRIRRKSWNKINEYLKDITKIANAIRYGNLTEKIDELDIPEIKQLSTSLNRMIDTLHDREVMIVEYQNGLATQNKLLEAVIGSLSDGLIILDSDFKILQVTSKIVNWFGGDKKKIIGHTLPEFMILPKTKPLLLLKDDEVKLIYETDFNFTANVVELNLEDKKERYVMILKNITDQKELESLKEDFVATLTHDLKVPIIAESNMLELFLQESFGEISDKQQLALKNMQASNKELLELVQTVLDTYKFKDGKISLFKENILLKAFINEIISEMSPITVKTSNKIIFNFERDIRVYADKFQLKRVIKNLIQNAILYGAPKSPIEITIGEIPQYIIIKIKDYGAGIPKDEIEKIFNKYYSASKKFRKIGTGLGLFLSLQIIKAHQGGLTVDSKEGEFTEFCIKIPVQ